MYNFSFFNPVKVFFGVNTVEYNYQAMNGLGKKALLVTGRNSAKSCGAYDDIIKAFELLKIEYCLFDKVMENPTFQIVRECSAFGKENKVDFIVGIGGGSPIDTAKAVAVLLKNPELKLEDLYEGKFKETLPIVAIPTTSGTGSEVTQFSVLVSDDNKKAGFKNDIIYPVVSYVDPKYTLNLSKELTITTAIDALSHSVEGTVSLNSNTMSDLYAEKSIRLIKEYLPKIVEGKLNEEEVRSGLSLASMYGGVVISQTSTTLPHVLGYGLTTNYNLRHGLANGVFLASFVKRVDKYVPQKTKIVRDIFGSIENFEKFLKDVGVYDNMPQISDKDIEEFSDTVFHSRHMKTSPIAFSIDEIKEIYSEVFR